MQQVLCHPVLEHSVLLELLDEDGQPVEQHGGDLARLDIVDDVILGLEVLANDDLVQLVQEELGFVDRLRRFGADETLLGVEGVRLGAKHPLDLILGVLVSANEGRQRKGDVLGVGFGPVLDEPDLELLDAPERLQHLERVARAGEGQRRVGLRAVVGPEGLGSTRVIQRLFNVSVPRARVPEKASTRRGRCER